MVQHTALIELAGYRRTPSETTPLFCPNPACAAAFSVPTEQLGRIVACPRCAERFCTFVRWADAGLEQKLPVTSGVGLLKKPAPVSQDSPASVDPPKQAPNELPTSEAPLDMGSKPLQPTPSSKPTVVAAGPAPKPVETLQASVRLEPPTSSAPTLPELELPPVHTERAKTEKACVETRIDVTSTQSVSEVAEETTSFSTPIAPGAGTVNSLAESPDLPKQIGRFVIRDLLCQSSLGQIYRADHPEQAREVLVLAQHKQVVRSKKAVETFLAHARKAAQLRHSHVLPLAEAGCDGTYYYISSEKSVVRNLEEALQQSSFTYRQAALLVKELASILHACHLQGLVHRDLRSAQVWFERDGNLCLVGVGLAHRQDFTEKLVQDEVYAESLPYLAPEHVAGYCRVYRPSADQYSLGVILYRLLTGQVPFTGPPMVLVFNLLQGRIPAPRLLQGEVPPGLEAICLKMLAKDPEQRYDNCQELAEALSGWLEHEDALAHSPEV